jgi:DNA-binding LacI/PurR family transcriptional regulator
MATKLSAKQRAKAQEKARLVKEVANATGYSPSHVRRVLNGTRKNKEISSVARDLKRRG